MSLESFGEVARWLRDAKGFRQVRGKLEGSKAFHGEIQCQGQAVGIRLEIVDWDFVDYPRIFLESVPDQLKGFRLHVLAGGGLCYLGKRAIVLDRYRPVEAIARCLVQAQKTLDEVTRPREHRFEQQDEFGIYWNEGSVLTGRIDSAKASARLVFVESGDRNFYVLTQDSAEAEWLSKSVNGRILEKREIPVWLVRADQYPSVDQQGLPKTIKELLSWLKSWDVMALRRLEGLLESRTYLDHATVAFMFSSPIGWFGFFLNLDSIHRRTYRRKPALYRQYLYTKGGQTSIKRIFGVDVSPEFIHSRNISTPSLMGKKVTIVGCGAIGGYLAGSLIRLGAGVGSKGRLTLIDFDEMSPGNLGRHALGFPTLFRAKAEALRDELALQFPYASLRALNKDARECAKLFDEDLVIDATGEEALSIALGHAHQEFWRASQTPPPILHVWIAGNGEAAQVLFVDGKKGGCFRCMWADESNGRMRDRFPLLKGDANVKYLGCQAVTTFPVSAAMSATSVASDVVIDWLLGNPSPRFRTRTRENSHIFAVKNQDIAKVESCPSCRRI